MTRPIITARRALTRGELLDWNQLELERPITEDVEVTPEIAAVWLQRDQVSDETFNRHTDVRRVERYARDMANDNWWYTGHPIVFDWDGHVRDGGHRLLAVIKSKRTIRFNVVYGVDPRSQHGMDRLRPRSVKDDMDIAGLPNGMTVASIASLILRWRSGKIFSSNWQPSDMEKLDMIEREPNVHVAARQAIRIWRNTPQAAKSVLGTMWHEAYELDSEACERFFDLYYSGRILDDRDSAILAIRNAVIRYGSNGGKKPRQEYQLYQMVKAWNTWRVGKEAKYIIVPRSIASEKFPVLR